MKTCTKCGFPAKRKEARFCGKCGAKLPAELNNFERITALVLISGIVLTVAFFLIIYHPSSERHSAGSEIAGKAGTTASAPASVAEPPTSVSTLSSANAWELTLGEPKLLDPDGEYPDFSPDGGQVLFDKGDCLWLVAKDGSNQRQLTCNAKAGSFSPDGSKIAFFSPYNIFGGDFQGTLSVFDLKTGKSLALDPQWVSLPRLYWAKDESKIFGFAGGSDATGVVALDLQTLKHESATAFHDEYTWLRESGVSPVLLNVNLVDLSADQPFAAAGIWAVNVENSSKKLLLPGTYVQLRLSPDLSAIAFSKGTGVPWSNFSTSQWNIQGRGIYLAALTRQTHPVERKFSVAIGSARLEPMFNQVLGGIGGAYTHCTLEGQQVYGGVNGPRINPLNGKTVGPNDTQKAVVQFTKMSEKNSEIEVVSAVEPVSAGDVLGWMWIDRWGNCDVNVSDEDVLVKPGTAVAPHK